MPLNSDMSAGGGVNCALCQLGKASPRVLVAAICQALLPPVCPRTCCALQVSFPLQNRDKSWWMPDPAALLLASVAVPLHHCSHRYPAGIEDSGHCQAESVVQASLLLQLHQIVVVHEGCSMMGILLALAIPWGEAQQSPGQSTYSIQAVTSLCG